LPIWIDFMKAALAQAPADRFDIPDTVIAKSIDPVKGTPLSPDHPDAVPALFRQNR
jgi:membrane carboxypeptidase/penicillin-binding protein